MSLLGRSLEEVWLQTRNQRCWVQKTANVLKKMPTKTKKEPLTYFLINHGVKYQQASVCLEKDRQELLTFYDFPAEPWKHIRTTNPIESSLPQSDTAPNVPRGVYLAKQRSSWFSSSSKPPKKPGAALTARTSCQKSSSVSNSVMDVRTLPMMNELLHEQAPSPTFAINSLYS